MRIAFVHKSFGLNGGTERMLESLVRGLRDRGHDVHVFCDRVDPRFQRARLATFHRVPAGGPGSGLRALRLLVGSALRVRRKQFDVVVHMGRTGPRDVYRAGGGCHRTWFELLRSRAEGAFARLRLAWSLKHRIALWHERRALLTSSFVVPSERARDDLRAAYGGLADGVRVLPNGVDTDRFHPKGRRLFFGEQRDDLGIGPEELVLLFVGSDGWRKGLDRVLAALSRLAPRREELRLLVLGDDPHRATFEATARSLGVRERVTFLGAHPAPEKLYAATDLLVLPTRHDPFANVTLEALAAGMPVITTGANGAAREIGAGEALRVLEDPDDPEELAATIEECLDPIGLPHLREVAREVAVQWAEDPFVDRWEAHLKEIAGG